MNESLLRRACIGYLLLWGIVVILQTDRQGGAAPAPIVKSDRGVTSWPTGVWTGPDNMGGICTLTFYADRSYTSWCWGQDWEGRCEFSEKTPDVIKVVERRKGFDFYYSPVYYTRTGTRMKASWVNGEFKHGRR
jgi:hypothetical protein